uniref:Secreted protein n=1 Tax=Panagrellus redivivus TaxID=6233 RepID=A0A7E4ZZH4_PANRE
MFSTKVAVIVVVSAFAMACLFVPDAQGCAATTNGTAGRRRREAVSEAAVVVLETAQRYDAASSDKILQAVTKQVKAIIDEADVDEEAFGAVSKSVAAGANGNVQVLFAVSHGSENCDELERVVTVAVNEVQDVVGANVLCGGSTNSIKKQANQ